MCLRLDAHHLRRNRASYARLLAGDGTAITDTVAGRLDVQCAGAVTVTNATANNFLCNANLQVGDADVDGTNKVPVEGLSTQLSMGLTPTLGPPQTSARTAQAAGLDPLSFSFSRANANMSTPLASTGTLLR